ncbi:MAG: LPS-assembly protein LptD [Cyclobacteriaceae bacterium]|nr:LPS-assembly protein LptD [Cyclobacteriaceae bacterium]
MLKLKHVFIVLVCIFGFQIDFLYGQDNPEAAFENESDFAIPPDSIPNAPSPSDSLIIVADSVANEEIGDIETTIFYDATDSILMNVAEQIVNLYGEAKITYGEIELTAAYIEINYATHLIKAEGVTDSLGNKIGKPIFKEGDQVYETDDMKYNFESRKAIIDGVVTQQGEAVMHGEKVYKNQLDELYIANARYTTCNMGDPHFYVKTQKLKVIPGKKVITGPFHIRVKDIPIPVGLPFGILPVPKKKLSGIIPPSYGEEKRRGFFLKNGGYYFALSDYMDMNLTGDIYTKGSWGLNASTSYIKRYKYGGQFSARYNNQKGLNEGDSTVTNDFWINWSHTPQSKGSASRFSASVSAGTSTYNQNNPTADLRNTLNQDFNSSLSFSTPFKGTPFSMNVSSRLQQNINTGLINLLLPELALNMTRIYPFKFGATTSKNWVQKISFSWNMNSTNRATNNRIGSPGFAVDGYDPANDTIVPLSALGVSGLWDRAQNGIRHQIPISTSMNILKFITFSPSFSYSELWYFKELNFQWNPESAAVKVDTLTGFSRAYQYTTSGSFNTRLYGTLNFKGEKIQAIRHVMIPSVSMGYSPDFSTEKYGYYQEVQVDSLGRTRRLSKYQGFVYGTPSAGQSATASFSLSNNLEMKVKTKKDTTDKARKVVLLDNLSFSTSYNFLADSFQLAPVRISARTKIFNKKLDISFNSTLDPYIYQLDSIYFSSRGEKRVSQRKRNIYAWEVGKGFGQMTQASLAVGMSLNPKAREKANQTEEELGPLSAEEEMQLAFIRNNPELYVDFSIPWNLSFNYNITYRKTGYEDADIIQALTFNGSITFTEKWNMSFNSGFDFESLKFTQTTFNISRDLHCWQLMFNYTPFGRYQSYYLTINAKSSLLQDLKVNKQRSWFDN